MKPDQQGKHALTFILITVFMNMIGLGLVVPVIPDLIREIGGIETSGAAVTAGWLLFSYAGMQFFFAPVMGNLSDRYGRRPILLFSMAGLAVDYLIMALAPSFFLLFVGRVLAGMMGATLPAANAAVADLSTSDTRSRNYGLVGAAGAAGLVFGPALGGYLGAINVRLPFFVAAGVSAFAVVYGYFVLSETLSRDKRRKFELKRSNPIGSFSKVAHQPVVIAALASLFFFQLAAQCMPSVWPFFALEQLAWTKVDVGLSISVYAIALVAVQGGLTGPVTRRFGSGRAGVFSLIVLVLTFLGLAFSQTGLHAYFWMLFGALHGFAFPALQTLMTRRMGERVQGELQGAIASTLGITAIIGPLIATQVFGRFTDEAGLYFPGAAFVTGAFSLLISIACLLWAMQQDGRLALAEDNHAA